MYMPYLNTFACCSKLLHLMNVSLKSINLTARVSTTKWNMIGFFKLLISRFIVSVICSKYLWNLLYKHTITSWNAHYVFFGVTGDLRAVSRIQTVSYSGFGKIFTSELILPRRDPSFSSTSWCVYGLTMGAYFKFCCCIDERVQLFQVYPMLLSQPYFAHCYVDNRAHQEIFRFAR